MILEANVLHLWFIPDEIWKMILIEKDIQSVLISTDTRIPTETTALHEKRAYSPSVEGSLSP